MKMTQLSGLRKLSFSICALFERYEHSDEDIDDDHLRCSMSILLAIFNVHHNYHILRNILIISQMR